VCFAACPSTLTIEDLFMPNASLIARTTAALALGALATGAAHADTDLVVNGGFETGNFSGWTLSDTSLTRAGRDAPHDGTYEAKLGNRNPSTMDQVIPTVAGQSYTIDMFVGRLGLLASGDAFSFTGSLGGKEFLSLTAATLPLNSPYAEYTATVVASSDNALLRFAYVDQPSYILLDDIRVTGVSPVPELPAGALMLAGLAMLGPVGARRFDRR
jgi:hypothetical protein